MDHIQFLSDIPYSKTNSEIYRDIYHLEQWLRRIAYISMRICYGERWSEQIPLDIRRDLRARAGNLKGKILLDCDNSSNLLWLSTLEELRTLMISDPQWSFIKKLTGFTETDFTNKLNFLREIRNIVGHNRATTPATSFICKGHIGYFGKGIIKFKKKFYYDGHDNDFEGSFCELLDNHDVLYTGGHFFSIFLVGNIYSGKDDSIDPCVNIGQLLESFKDADNLILAITVEIEGWGYGLLCPKDLCGEDVDNITKRIIELEPHIWSEKDYLSQDAKYLCDPKVWFVSENPGPDGDNFGTIKQEDADNRDMNTSRVDNPVVTTQENTGNKDNIVTFPKI